MTVPHETIFSPCRKYRYTLWRDWSDLLSGGDTGFVMFIGLNPSTADETKDDPTIRRCVQYAKYWGFGALCMTNLFAWRATDPKEMKQVPEPVGILNNNWLLRIASEAQVVVACWGNDGGHMGRSSQICKKLGTKLHVLKLNEKTGQPAHPLYLSKTLRPVPWPL